MKNLSGLVIAFALLMTAVSGAAADGKQIYAQNCAGCHNGLSPKLGDKAAWEPRIKRGLDALVASAIKGKGGMPPRGGHIALPDDDIKAAVEYMVSQAR